MLYLAGCCAGFRYEIWTERARPGAINQDTWFLDERDGGIRIAAIDGVTPKAQTPAHAGVDGGAWGASVVRAALGAHRPLDECARAANDELFDPAIAPSRNRPQATLAACDINPRGISGVRFADAEIWMMDASGAWSELAPGDMLAPGARQGLDALIAEGLPHEEYKERETLLLDDPMCWESTAIGRFPIPRGRSCNVPANDWGEVIVASDGALLTASRCARIDAWLAGELRQRERELTHGNRSKERDDVTVVRVRRA